MRCGECRGRAAGVDHDSLVVIVNGVVGDRNGRRACHLASGDGEGGRRQRVGAAAAGIPLAVRDSEVGAARRASRGFRRPDGRRAVALRARARVRVGKLGNFATMGDSPFAARIRDHHEPHLDPVSGPKLKNNPLEPSLWSSTAPLLSSLPSPPQRPRITRARIGEMQQNRASAAHFRPVCNADPTVARPRTSCR